MTLFDDPAADRSYTITVAAPDGRVIYDTGHNNPAQRLNLTTGTVTTDTNRTVHRSARLDLDLAGQTAQAPRHPLHPLGYESAALITIAASATLGSVTETEPLGTFLPSDHNITETAAALTLTLAADEPTRELNRPLATPTTIDAGQSTADAIRSLIRDAYPSARFAPTEITTTTPASVDTHTIPAAATFNSTTTVAAAVTQLADDAALTVTLDTDGRFRISRPIAPRPADETHVRTLARGDGNYISHEFPGRRPDHNAIELHAESVTHGFTGTAHRTRAQLFALADGASPYGDPTQWLPAARPLIARAEYTDTADLENAADALADRWLAATDTIAVTVRNSPTWRPGQHIRIAGTLTGDGLYRITGIAQPLNMTPAVLTARVVPE